MNCRLLSAILLSLAISAVSAQTMTMLKQRNMARWGVGAANYSGITHLTGNRYAVVSDKTDGDGYYEFSITIDSISGQIVDIRQMAFHHTTKKSRDAEGIVSVPERNSVFICAEDDQRIIEYNMQGQHTGWELPVPEALSKDMIYDNYGFEALGRSRTDGTFWTCTESTLKSTGVLPTATTPHAVTVRMQSWGADFRQKEGFDYTTDIPTVHTPSARLVFGVPEVTVLDDGRMLVMEREFCVKRRYIGSYVINKVYLISTQNPGEKMLMAEWKTKVNITKRNIANYEAMCLGPKLADGRQTVLFLSDSQNGYGNAIFHLKDYIRVGIINPK